MPTPAESPGDPSAGPASQNPIEVLHFTSPHPDIPDLEVVIDRRGMGSLRVRWCEKKLSRPALEALLVAASVDQSEARNADSRIALGVSVRRKLRESPWLLRSIAPRRARVQRLFGLQSCIGHF